ncbi:UrcA family protein [Novosphingobium sp. CF614]|uniref:UrcA family protein n=1 Tax=Novosphingobium sp. CF614 TaxID=1884364 RepID=UPI0008E7F07F|nr:UrcA family protein [Novosphingobium sp. CF614]SFG22992.1 UrcA family protein [Novosphingobium sp. CF614]
MFKNAPIAAALLGLALTATPAFAGEATKVQVMYKDLDLTTPEGQRKLERRLDMAAREACGYDQRVTGSHLPSAQSQACYKQARAKAKDSMAAAIGNADGRLGG